MAFNSIVFLFFFLPISLIIYYLGGRYLRNGVLVLISLLFYAWGGMSQLTLLPVIIGINFLFGLLIFRFSECSRRVCLAIGVVINLAVLFHYKYTSFFVQNLIVIRPDFIPQLPDRQGRLIPMGLSFITFHAVSYLVDVYRGMVPGQKNFLRLALYFTFFPKILSGPILRYVDAMPQLGERRLSLASFAAGTERFIIGLGKKILIANTLADMADSVFATPFQELSVGMAWLGIVCYTLQIYYDFSGYTDMAIGLGRMFGFQLPENFTHPYRAQSVREFWQRWNITLSLWFREYLYIPLGGNRHGAWRTYFNLTLVFLLCGFWHGAGWNFIIWGLLHGIVLVLERWRLAVILIRLPRVLRHCYVLLFLLLSWVFFRTNTPMEACHFLGAMLGLGIIIPQSHPLLLLKMDMQLFWVLAVAIPLSFPLVPALENYFEKTASVSRQPELLCSFMQGFKILLLAFILLFSIMELAGGSYNPFIYFRF